MSSSLQLVVSGDHKVLAVQLPGLNALTPRLVDRLDELIEGPYIPDIPGATTGWA